MKLTGFSERLGRLQVAHPWRFLITAAIITAVSGVLASGLEFDSSYEALLPEEAPQIKNSDNIRERTGGTRQVVVAISGEDEQKRIDFGTKLAERLAGLDNIRATDLKFPVDFFKERGLWLMNAATLKELVPALEEAVKIAKWQANPMHLHLEEEEEKAELEAAWKKVDKIVNKKKNKLPFEEILTSKDGKYTFLLVVPSIKFADMKAGRAVLAAIWREIDTLNPSAHGVEVRSAGNLDMMQEQHRTISRDLKNASLLALVLGVLIVAAFTRRPSAPLFIGVPLIIGVTWTFALARLIVGHVNIVTGFLVAVLIGLGIDFGVHIFIRFQQERRDTKHASDRKEAVIRAIVGTLPPALTSALTTAGTFFSFVIADFRGFSEFGLIAGLGVIMTLAASFVILPSLLVVTGRRQSSRPLPALTSRRGLSIVPQRLAMAIVIAAVTFAAFGLWHAGEIPFRNNFRLLRGTSPATEFLDYVDENVGIGFNPTVILTRNVDHAAAVAALARQQKTDGLSGDPSRIGKVFSIADLLPQDSKEVRRQIEKLRGILDDPKLDRAEKKGGERGEQLALARRMSRAEPWGIDELPEVFRRRLTTKDGSEFIVFVWPKERNDADYQAAAWEDELNILSKKMDAAEIVHSMADETLILAWIYRLILADGPPLLAVAAAVVLIFLMLDFRSLKRTALVAFPLSIGMLSFIGTMYALGMELNMFNIIVVPSIIGIGIDNVVHIYHRYRDRGLGSIIFVLRTTGTAALLASLTTGIGFGSSVISHHLGLKSLGILAVLGIASTFIAAAFFFPCLLTLLEKRNEDHRKEP